MSVFSTLSLSAFPIDGKLVWEAERKKKVEEIEEIIGEAEGEGALPSPRMIADICEVLSSLASPLQCGYKK